MTTTIYNSNNPPIKGLAWSTDFALYSQAETKILITGATLAAGDVIVFKDGVLDGNIDTLPTEIGSSGILLVSLSATEMNADKFVTVKFHDQAGAQWCDAAIIINTVSTGTALASTSEVDSALSASHGAGSWVDTGAPPTVGQIDTQLSTTHGVGSWVDTVAPTAPTIADAVWDELVSDHLNAGSTGAKLNAINTGTSVANIADGVWDELLAGHAIAGSAGASLSAAGSSADPLLNTVPGTYVGGTAGYNLGRIGSGQIITTSVVAQSGDVETYQGDAYLNTDGRRIDWTDVSAAWPVLTAATILVVIGGDVSFAGTVVTATGASKKVGVELTAAQTLTIPATEDSGMEFVVRATLSNGSVVTLVAGKWNSKRQLVVGS